MIVDQEKTETSFLAKAGAVLGAVVKHVPARGVLWGIIGLVVGAVCVGLSFVTGVLVLDRGALLLGYVLAIPFAIPFLGAALFFMHGLHRGAARALLEIEQKFGLVRHVVDRIFALLEARLGERLRNVPLQQLETALKATVATYLGSDDVKEGSGLAAWVVRRGKRAVARRIESFLLAAYRAEHQGDGSGGGVSLEKVAARVHAEIAQRFSSMAMSPLNKQLAVLMTLYVLIAGGWWFWLLQLMRLIA